MANVVNLYGNAAAIPLDELATMSKAQLVQCATILHSALTVANKNKFAAQRELELLQSEVAGAEVSPEKKFICELEGKISALQEELRNSQQALRKIAGENGNLKRYISGDDVSKLMMQPQQPKVTNTNFTPPPSPSASSSGQHQQKTVSFSPTKNSLVVNIPDTLEPALPISPSSSTASRSHHHRRSSSEGGLSEMTPSPQNHHHQNNNSIASSSSIALNANLSSLHQQSSIGSATSGRSNSDSNTHNTQESATTDDTKNNTANFQILLEQEKKKWQKEQMERELAQKEATKLYLRRTEDQLKQQFAQQQSNLEASTGVSSRQAQAKIAMLEDELSRLKTEFSEQARVLRLRESTDVQYLRQMNEKLSNQGEKDRETIFKLKNEVGIMTSKLRELESDMEERIRDEMMSRLDELEDEDDDILATLLPTPARGNLNKENNSPSNLSLMKRLASQQQKMMNKKRDSITSNGSSADIIAQIQAQQHKTLVEAETQTESFMMRLVDVIKQREDELRSAKLEIHSLTEQVLKLNREMNDCKRENEELKHDAKRYSGLVNEMQNQMKTDRSMSYHRSSVRGVSAGGGIGSNNNNTSVGSFVSNSNSSTAAANQRSSSQFHQNPYQGLTQVTSSASLLSGVNNNNQNVASGASRAGSFLSGGGGVGVGVGGSSPTVSFTSSPGLNSNTTNNHNQSRRQSTLMLPSAITENNNNTDGNVSSSDFGAHQKSVGTFSASP